ncbi:MAG: radical SAM protein [Thermoplasmatales archaeon]|nr:MAG: radical SAM protein [Thermoplasmatales archaeon]
MIIREIRCKTALSASSLPGLTYSLNPYRGCQHKCAYCYVPNVIRVNRNDWGSFVDVTTNIPKILSTELKNKKTGVVGISTVTDPYQPVEKKYKFTRLCLEQLLIHDFPICIQTKSDLIKRDYDIISKFSKAEVMISIATLNDKERKLLEPNSSSIQSRLDVVRFFSDLGIKTNIFFGPIYPSITKNIVTEIIDVFIEYGAQEIMMDKLNLKPDILENIEKISPDLKNLIKNDVSNKELFNEILRVCKKKGIDATVAFPS